MTDTSTSTTTSTTAASTTTLPPVIREVTVPVTRQRAFDVYVRDYSDWTIKDHHLGAELPLAIVLEPVVGGRWYERQPDGSECDWGRVLELDEPHRVVLAWHIGVAGDSWAFDPDPAHASRVEVEFVALAEDRTVVRVTHSELAAHGDGAAAIHAGVADPEGWELELATFAAACAHRSD